MTAEALAVLRTWVKELPPGGATPLFPTRTGRVMRPDAIAARLNIYSHDAVSSCPSLSAKRAGHPARPPTHRRDGVSSTPVSTPSPSPCGSGTPAATSHRSTCTQTWPSRSVPSPAPHPPAPDPVATSPATDSWPSSKSSDYADLSGSLTARTSGPGVEIGIARTST